MIYDKPAKPFRTITADCWGDDSVRVWPLSVVGPWNEVGGRVKKEKGRCDLMLVRHDPSLL